MYARSLAIVAALLFASQAHATPRNTAKAHVDKAMKAHKQGKFDVALDELKAAYALDPKPDLLFAIAQVYVKLDKCEDAISYYEKFDAVTKDAQAKQVVAQAIDACKAKIAPKPPDPPPPDPALTNPQPDPTPPPQPDPISQPPNPQPDPGPVGHSPDDPFAAGRSDKPNRSPFYKDKVGDVLVVGGVAAGVVGLVMWRGAVGDLDDAEKASTLDGYNDKVDSAHSKRTISVIAGAAGAALVTVGIVRFVTHGKKKQETARVGLVPTTDGGLVTWLGRF